MSVHCLRQTGLQLDRSTFSSVAGSRLLEVVRRFTVPGCPLVIHRCRSGVTGVDGYGAREDAGHVRGYRQIAGLEKGTLRHRSREHRSPLLPYDPVKTDSHCILKPIKSENLLVLFHVPCVTMSALRACGWVIKRGGLPRSGGSPSCLMHKISPRTRATSPSISRDHTSARHLSQQTAPLAQQSAAAQAAPREDDAAPKGEASAQNTAHQNKYFKDVHFLGDAAGKIVIRSPPVFRSAASSRLYHKQHLAAAFRVFAKQGFDEGVAGHISLRDPAHPHHFWINPLSKHFSQIRVSDLVLVDDKGNVLPGGAQLPINGPAFAIHSEIHKARPDVNAACHAHSVYGKAFSTFGRVIEPLYQDAIRFYNDLSGGDPLLLPPLATLSSPCFSDVGTLYQSRSV